MNRDQPRMCRRRLASRAVILFACAVVLVAAPPAAAYVTHTPSGHFLSITPKPGTALGPAAQANRLSPLAPRAAAESASPSLRANRNAGIPPGIYNVTWGATYPDTTAYPANGCVPGTPLGMSDPPYVACFTDAQVQSEIQTIISANHLPTDNSAIYFLHLPQGIDECSGPGAESPTNPCADKDFCAYHSSFGTSSAPLYGVMPYAHIFGCATGQSPNSNFADDTISVLSHEHIETITDPFGTAWLSARGNEIGDLCAAPDVFGTALGGAAGHEYNQTINSHNYYLQDEYADTDGSNLSFDSCEQRPGAAADGFAQPSPPAVPDPGPLLYQGGPVLGQHKVYDIYWGPASGPNSFPAMYASTIDTFLQNVAAESQKAPATRTLKNVYDVGAEYGTISPTASFTGPATAHAGETVTFDASASSDPTGSPTYHWEFGDGASTFTSQPTITHAYSATNSHIVTLTVTDQFGGSSSPASRTIHIFVPPTASFTVPATINTGQQATFDASASGGPDAPITSYSWSFGDGGTGTGVKPVHTYVTPGVYSVTLTVTDANSDSATATQPASVVEPPPPPPPPPPAVATLARSGTARAVLVNGHVIVFLGRAIGCPSRVSSCVTTAKLTTRVAGRRKTRGRRPKPRTTTIGSATIRTAGGATTVLSVRLNAQGTALLRRLRHLNVTASISIAGAGVQAATSTLTFTINQPASKRRRKR